MMLCPHCQQGNLVSEGLGYRCDFCKDYIRVDEVLIYYGNEEENEKDTTTDTDSQAD